MTELPDTDALLRRVLALSLALVQGEDDTAAALKREMTCDPEIAAQHLHVAALAVVHLGAGLLDDDLALVEPALLVSLTALLDEPTP